MGNVLEKYGAYENEASWRGYFLSCLKYLHGQGVAGHDWVKVWRAVAVEWTFVIRA